MMARLSLIEANRLGGAKWREFLGWLNSHQAARWLFRGEPKCKTTLRPAIGRNPTLWTEGREFLLYERFALHSRRFHAGGSLHALELLALAQHHRVPTRLLDWTTNPFAAAYFAVDCALKDVVVHAVDAAEVSFVRPGELISFDAIRSQNATRFVEVPPLTPRIVAQRGLFSLHHAPLSNWKPAGREQVSDCFEIPDAAKPYFLRRLHQLGVDASAIMTDLDGLGASLAWWYRSGLMTPSTIGRKAGMTAARKGAS